MNSVGTLLIIKTGAAGDVVRTSVLLHLFKDWIVDWFVDESNSALINRKYVRNVFTNPAELNRESYDLVINLEDDVILTRSVLSRVHARRLFGAYEKDAKLAYTDDSSEWFDMSLSSRYGLDQANFLKLNNRRSFQEIIFSGLGTSFDGQRYVLPEVAVSTDLYGDIAIAAKAGNRWPNKNWAYYDKLSSALRKSYVVNVLPQRETLQEHIADIAQHKFLICNDSLPMHIALGLNIPVVSFFICTSPWEIFDYGLLTKIVSPSLEKWFYRRDYDPVAVSSITFDTALEAIRKTAQQFLGSSRKGESNAFYSG